MLTAQRHRRRAKKNRLVSMRPNGSRKYLKAMVRQKNTKNRGSKNIHQYITGDDVTAYETPWRELNHTISSGEFVLQPNAAAQCEWSLYDLLPQTDRKTIDKARRRARIRRLGGVRFALNSESIKDNNQKERVPTKTHDGLLPEHEAATRFFCRILGQTGESGQGWIKSSQNGWGRWVANPCSWSPQVAWDAIPDELKRKTAAIIASFFRRWNDAYEGRLVKFDVVRWGTVGGKEPQCRTIRRKNFQILPNGGCDIALSPVERVHKMWVDKMRSSPTIQGILRAPISAIHPTIRDRLTSSLTTATQLPAN